MDFIIQLVTRIVVLTSCAQLALASVGVVDINNLLQPQLSDSLFTPPTPPTPLHEHDHSPWSHEPYCTTSTLDKTYCVYTSNTTGPYGLSLLFTPSAAHAATTHINDVPISSFLSPDEAEALYLQPSPWRVVDIPGKDKGVVATRRIKKYETFMIDQAAVVVDMETDKVLGKGVRSGLLRVAIERLRRPGVVRGMSGRHEGSGGDDGGEEGEGQEEREREMIDEDILTTNAFGSTVAGVGTHALYPLISRINHACDPNSFVLFARAGVSMAIKAYRDIEEGEEITISYLPLGLPHKERRESIQRWGFSCSCSLCSLTGREREASDLRRLMIAQSEEKVIELAQSYEIATAIQVALDAVGLTKDEDLESMLTDEYAMLAMLYLESGDRTKAEEYGRKAWVLLGDLGYLGTKEGRGVFSLKTLLDGIEKLGGKGRAWKSLERERMRSE